MKRVHQFWHLVNGMAEHAELKNEEKISGNRLPRGKRQKEAARAKVSLMEAGERHNTNMKHLIRRFVKTIKVVLCSSVCRRLSSF